ncbi:MAG: hypothetical protein V3V01_20715 [Acidimicrobiales bacterium]
MASIREKRPGYWEVRVFVGYDDEGKPVQVSKAIRGGKRDAERLAAQLSSRPAPRSGKLTVAELLDEYLEHRALRGRCRLGATMRVGPSGSRLSRLGPSR